MPMPISSRNKRKERSSPEPLSWIPSSSSSYAATDNLSSSQMQSYHLPGLPPGYKFVPNDEEIVGYLKRYSEGNKTSLLNVPIHRVNIYESDPEQLSVNYMKGNETEWFFISERAKMGNGKRNQKRGTNGGYWHATGAAKKIKQSLDGYNTSLSYYVGKQPNSIKTKWLMHEYSFESRVNVNEDVKKDYALYKIYISPQVLKKEKAEEEKNKKQKIEEDLTVAAHVEDAQEPCDFAYQQEQGTLLLPPPPLQYQDSMQQSDLGYWAIEDMFNIDELLNDVEEEDQDVCIPEQE